MPAGARVCMSVFPSRLVQMPEVRSVPTHFSGFSRQLFLEAGRMSSAPGAHCFTRQALGSTCLFLSQALDWRCVALHVLSFFFLKQEFCMEVRPQVLILGHGALRLQQRGPRPQKVLLACDSKGLQVN